MPTTTDRATPRLASDNLRALVATLAALGLTVVASVVGGFAAAAADLERDAVISARTTALTYFGFWIGYSLLYLLLTWLVFRGADAERLAAWLHESQSARRARRLRETFTGGSGPVGAVSFAAVAVAAVVVVAVVPAFRRDVLVVALAIGVVAVSWLLLVAAYALHYAREAEREGQLEFPGGAAPVLADYVYLAVQVSTTFSTSDVTITGTAMRRTASVHAVVAFVFNTVIVALLVSVLVGG